MHPHAGKRVVLEKGETRRRRVGEKLWALIMLEAWVRHVVEGKSS